MNPTVYAKYTDYRNDAYRILTRVHEDETGRRTVTKESAENAHAQGHLEAIARAHGTLRDLYGDTLTVCPCAMEDGRVVFEYVSGKTYQDVLNEAVHDGSSSEKLREAFARYVEILEGGEKNAVPFSFTPEFQGVFGVHPELAGLPALRVANLDATGDNLIIDEDGHLTLIDYEWVLAYPVPRDFVVYRNLRVMHDAHWAHDIRLDTLLRLCGVTLDVPTLRALDDAFTQHISRETDGRFSRAQVLQQHDLRFTPRNDLYRRTNHYVFYDTGNGFNEREKLVIPARSADLNLTLDVRGVSAIRFDPYGGAISALRNVTCTTQDGTDLALRPVLARVNGSEVILENPANVHIIIPEGTESISLRGSVALFEDENAVLATQAAIDAERDKLRVLSAQLAQLQAETGELRAALDTAQASNTGAQQEAASLRETINALYNSTSWRATKWLRGLSNLVSRRGRK